MNPIWVPTAERVANAAVTDLMAHFNSKLGRSIHDYAGLHKFSVHESEEFWDGMWEHAKLIGTKTGATLVRRAEMPGAQFYPESLINFAENCLAHDAPDNETAIISYTETGARTELTWKELRQQVANFRYTLIELGVQSEDVVAGFVSNGPEAIVASLATLSLGCLLYTSPSPRDGLLSRMPSSA